MSKSKSHHVIAGRLRSECSSSTFNHQASLSQLVGLVDSIAAAADFFGSSWLNAVFFCSKHHQVEKEAAVENYDGRPDFVSFLLLNR